MIYILRLYNEIMNDHSCGRTLEYNSTTRAASENKYLMM
jgi:hypothetical protein